MTAPINYSPALEDKLFSLLDQMRTNEIKQAQKEGREYGIHGLCAVLGYDPEQHSSYISRLRAGTDIFQNKGSYLQDPEALAALQEGMKIDGAILIDHDGRFLHSGKYIKCVEESYDKHPHAEDTYLKLQEKADAGTRHMAAIALSAERPDLLIYTLKSDHPELRIFKGGLIYRSTVPGEVKTVSRYQPELV